MQRFHFIVKTISQLALVSIISLIVGCSDLVTSEGGYLSDGSSRSATWSGTNVRLLNAQPFNYAVSGMTWDLVYYTAHVKNVGTPGSRVVSIYYNNGGAWTAANMTLQTAYSDYSIYKLDTLGGSTKEFVVRYSSSAGTFWDNNGGLNYKVQPWTSSGGFLNGVVGGNIGLGSAKVDSYSYFTGTGWSIAPKILFTFNVEDLSYNKQVQVTYSINGGTWATANAAYSYSVETGGGNRIQFWKADVPASTSTPFSGNIKFAIKYKNIDTGVEYWDNNFGQNYTLNLAMGTTIN